ncbi:hypothetical protein TWF192_005748 [Orbilia oligospora]|uniref:Uncharacterized protein n=1 Tax=Orbilia oligospora TaxID=2813651 RepID=A0A6G1MN90_ORBOL|nr:hypothetical protein TWF191_003892 [Orbilia oligospora]KAF3263467.1 hypothetical protein TWF192_005748 [Orbilia oligospora]
MATSDWKSTEPMTAGVFIAIVAGLAILAIAGYVFTSGHDIQNSFYRRVNTMRKKARRQSEIELGAV